MAAALLLSLSAVELALRTPPVRTWAHPETWDNPPPTENGHYTPDPRLIYRLKPAVRFDKGPAERATDALGFRLDPAHGTPVGADTPTIVIIGDSFVFGHGVGAAETMPHLLQEALGGTSSAIVHNAGVPGYGVDQGFLFLREEILPRLRVDVLVWSLNWNDVGDANRGCLFIEGEDGYKEVSARWNTLYWRFALGIALPDALRELKLARWLLSRIPARSTIGCSVGEDDFSPSRFAGKAAFLLTQANELVRAQGGRVISVIALSEFCFSAEPYDREECRTRTGTLADVLRASGIPFVDANEHCRDVGLDVPADAESDAGSTLFLTSEPFAFGDRHPSPAGNHCAAAAVARALAGHQ
jgi:hypothetical protein